MSGSHPTRTHEEHVRTRQGAGAAVAAFTAWGLSPIYWRFFVSFGALEVLVHRVIWSVVFLGIIISRKSGFADVWTKVKNPKILGLLCLSTTLIAINWFLFIWATMNERVLDASLGYFMNPLVNVVIGAVLLSERLSRPQIIAVTLAALGVANMSMDLTTIPWISITMAVTFGFYGYVRKTIDIEAVEGLFVETLLIMPLALGYFIWLEMSGAGHFFSGSLALTALLIFAGPFTSIPLMLFSFAARRLSLTSVGIAQYIAPSIHFILAVSYGEVVTTRHLITFGLIWTALAIYTTDAARKEMQMRKRMSG